MGKIFYIMGKKCIRKGHDLQRTQRALSTAWNGCPLYDKADPMQEKKTGVEYFFTDGTALAKMEAEHKIIEIRSYDTVHGIWEIFYCSGRAD